MSGGQWYEEGTASRLGDFIRSRRDELIAEWEVAFRQLPTAEKLEPAQRPDHLAELLAGVADAADRALRGEPSVGSPEGSEWHAIERLDEGVDLAEVVTEYTLLRSIVLRRWQREDMGDMHLDEVLILDEAFDRVIRESVARYTAARTRTLAALDRILTAAADQPAETAGFLRLLLRMLMETTASVDSVMLLLRDGDVLRARASVGLEDEVESGFCVPVGEGFAGRIAAEKRPLELRSAGTDPMVRSRFIKQRGVRALYGVPIFRGGEVIGVAHMGSCTAWEFSNGDKILFRTMVSRVSALLLQAELAERERAARIEFEIALARQRALFAAAPIGMAFFDAELRFMAINEWMAGINGFPVAAHIGQRLSEILPSPLAALVEGFLRRVVEERAALINLEFEGTTLGSPDVPRAWQASYYPVLGPDGTVLGAGGLVLDVTARKRAEEALRRREAEYRTLAESMPQIVWTAKPDGHFDYFNEEFCRYSGLPQEAGLGLGWRSVIHPEELPRVEMAWANSLASGEPADIEHRLRRHDGLYRWFVSRANPLKDESGTVLRWFGSTTDIDDIKRAQRELSEALDDRERVISILGHDLRNPLTTIVFATRLPSDPANVPPELRQVCTRVAGAAARIKRMIEDLMDFSRARTRTLPIRPGNCDLAELCRELVAEFEMASSERKIGLRSTGDTHGRWDRQRLAQVISNLLGNAIKHGAVDGPINLSVAGDVEVSLRVENRGAPIPPDLLPHLFEPFRSGSKPEGSSERGLGLGLYIVHEIVRAHGGRIEVQSNEVATAFTVILPRFAVEPATA